jgi:hypothetical protein
LGYTQQKTSTKKTQNIPTKQKTKYVAIRNPAAKVASPMELLFTFSGSCVYCLSNQSLLVVTSDAGTC